MYWFFHSVNNLTDNSADRSSVKGNYLDTFLSFVYAELRNILNLWQLTDRQLADTTTQRRHFFTDKQLADTTTGRHDKSQIIILKKLTDTRRHSPTETFLEKGWKEIFFSMSTVHVHGPLCICSLQKRICFCPSGIGWTKTIPLLINRKPKCPGKMYKKIRYTWALEISEVEVENSNQFCKEI